MKEDRFLEEKWQHYINWNDRFYVIPLSCAFKEKGDFTFFKLVPWIPPNLYRLQTDLQGWNMYLIMVSSKLPLTEMQILAFFV